MIHPRTTAVLLAALISMPALAKPVTAVIRLNTKVAMSQLAENAMTTGKIYTSQEIRDLAAPSAADYAKTVQQLKAAGFKIASESPTHIWITIRGKQSLFEKTFSVKMQATANGRRQLLARPTMPTSIPGIAGITGLDSTRIARHHHVVSPNAVPSGVTPQQIQAVYGFNPIYAAGIDGTGQHISIATYDAPTIADVQYYYQNAGLPKVPTVDEVNFNGTPAANDDSAMETSLDAEFTGMMAPGAAIHIFPSATNDDAGEAGVFTAILDDGRAHVVNYSWGGCEAEEDAAHITEMGTIFDRAVAQGVNIMAASGDTGSDGCRNNTVNPDFPASHPDIVAVGGTTLHIANNLPNETAWGPCAGGIAGCSGGGISTQFPLPSYQGTFAAPYTKRSYPDVAFNADNLNSGEAVYITLSGTNQWIVIGGTSMAAPQWTGFMALVEQARANKGLAPLGFFNPRLYAMTSVQRASMLNDATTGSNGAYTAGPGWDAVTGWGSMQANNLLNYLLTN